MLASSAVMVVFPLVLACGSFSADPGAVEPSGLDGGGDDGSPHGGDGGADAGPGVDAAAPSGAYAMEVAKDAPIAWYRLDDPAGSMTLKNEMTPASPAAVTGTVVLGVPSLVAGGGGAASFDGANGYLTLAGDFDFAGTAAYSLEAWISPNVIDSVYRRIFSNETGTPNSASWNGYLFSLQETQLRFGRLTSGVGCGPLIAPTFAAKTIHHVVATFHANTAELYVDGNAVPSSSTCVAPITVTRGTTCVGGAPTGSLFDGVLDEVAIYDKALDNARIAAHAAAGGLPR